MPSYDVNWRNNKAFGRRQNADKRKQSTDKMKQSADLNPTLYSGFLIAATFLYPKQSELR